MTPKDNDNLALRATQAAVLTALVLIAIKIIAWQKTDSVSFLASLTDSAMDLIASSLNSFAVYFAQKPADDNHKFGHGKAESLSSLAQALLIAASSLYLLTSSFERFYHPRPLLESSWGISVAFISLLLTALLVLFQRYVANKTRSQAVRADSIHYLTDLLSNGALLVVMFLAPFGLHVLDPILGIVISLYLLRSSWQIGEESVNALLDHELPDATREEILEKAFAVSKEVKGIHDLRTRLSGTSYIIQMHMDLDKNKTLFEAHAIADAVEKRLKEEFPGAEVIIHQDPV